VWIFELVAGGFVKVPVRSIYEAIGVGLSRADERDQWLMDKALRMLTVGQASFGLEGDPILDVTVVIGDGLRRSYCFVTVLDLD
jgi:hypothetical protein